LDIMQRVLGAALRQHPRDATVLNEMTWYLLPRWHGQPGDVRAFAVDLLAHGNNAVAYASRAFEHLGLDNWDPGVWRTYDAFRQARRWSHTTDAGVEPTVRLFTSGRYQSQIDGDWYQALENSSHRVPAVFGQSFGFYVELDDFPLHKAIDIHYRLLHPSLRHKASEPLSTTDEYGTKAPVYQLVGSYNLLSHMCEFVRSAPTELVPGKWQLEVDVDGHKISQTFEIFKNVH
jgi:hypothetical protein